MLACVFFEFIDLPLSLVGYTGTLIFLTRVHIMESTPRILQLLRENAGTVRAKPEHESVYSPLRPVEVSEEPEEPEERSRLVNEVLQAIRSKPNEDLTP